MERSVKVACVQVQPVVLDREATLDKLETVAAEAAREGAELVVFPETFVPVDAAIIGYVEEAYVNGRHIGREPATTSGARAPASGGR